MLKLDHYVSGNPSVGFDDELQHEIIDSNGWGDDYEGGFLYTGDESKYEGLTVLDHPHITAAGTVVDSPLPINPRSK